MFSADQHRQPDLHVTLDLRLLIKKVIAYYKMLKLLLLPSFPPPIHTSYFPSHAFSALLRKEELNCLVLAVNYFSLCDIESKKITPTLLKNDM